MKNKEVEYNKDNVETLSGFWDQIQKRFQKIKKEKEIN